MLKTKIVFLFILNFFSIFGQNYFIGDVDEKLINFLHTQNYRISGNIHYYANSVGIYSLDESTKKFTKFYTFIQNEHIQKLFSNEKGLIYNAIVGGTTDYYNIVQILNNGTKKTIDSFPLYNYEMLGCQFFIEDTMFFQIKKGNMYNLYKYFNNYTQKDSVLNSQNCFYIKKQFDDKIFYVTKQNNKYNFKLYHNNITIKLVENVDLYETEEVLSNDSLNLYFNVKYNDSLYSCFKYNKQTNEFSKFHKSFLTPLYFVSDTSIILSGDYSVVKMIVENDTISQIKDISVKNEYPLLSNPDGSTLSRFQAFKFPSKNLLLYTQNYGLEPAKIDIEDSITLISDYTKGRGSSITTISCGNAYADFYPKSFYFKGETYICLPNLFDGYYYLCKIKDDSIHSIFKFPEYDLYNINFHPTENFLYWSIYDQTKKINHLYKRSWGLENEIQPTSKSSDSAIWYNEFGIDNLNHSCYITGDNTIVNNVFIDKENNIYTSSIDRKYGGLFSNSIFYDRNNDTSILINQMQSIVKYDAFGKLIWYNNIGDRYKFWSDYDKFLLNKDGNPTIIGNYYQKAFFDTDSLTAAGSAIYIATLDKNNGKVLNKKNIQTSTYVDDFNITHTILDKKGDIYICFFYRNYHMNLGDTILYSDWNLQNAILKVDTWGNFIWAKNILTSYSDIFGQASSVKYDSITDALQVVYTQKGFFDCTDNNWKSELISIKSNGEIILRDLFLNGDAIHGNLVFENIGSGKLFLKAQYSGKINAQIFTNTTDLVSDCYANENYELIYDCKLKRFIQAKTSINNNFISPLESKLYHDTIYILGLKQGRQLCMQIYNLEGTFLGEKLFNQFQMDKPQNHHFDVKNGYIVLNGYEYQNDPKYQVNPILNNIYAISLLRIENKGWQISNLEMENMSIYSLNQHENISIFPNPVTDKFEVNFDNFTKELSDYQILDLNGKIILKGKIENRPFLNVDFSHQEQGVYIFEIRGSKNSYTFKIVKI